MTDRTRFSLPLIALHWLTLALLVLVYASAELREIFPKGSAGRASLRSWHEAFGLAVFGLVWLRLLVRTFSRAPLISPLPPRWQAALATAVHVALYGLMIVLPLSGWLMLNADGKAVTWLGYDLPTLVAASRPLARNIKEVHEAVASVGYALIGVHAAAALFHHYVVRDNTLRLMLPTARA
jgi:cytochrome b561